MALSPQGTAVVTGASSGIGAIYADRLASRGFDLILIARNRENLQKLASGIADRTGRSVEILAADLGSAEGMRAAERMIAADASVSMLVNNAGVGATAPLLAANVDEMEKLIALDVTALMRLTYAVAPGFVARGGGTIINIASIVAIGPEMLNGVYGGAKAFVLAFTQSLHHELGGKGVRVQAVLPGATRTEFWDRAGTPVEQLPGEIVMSAADMVDAALAGFDLGEIVTIPSLPEQSEWNSFEAARRAMMPKLSLAEPARRYRNG